MVLDRRMFVAGAAATLLPNAARASIPPSGVVGLLVSSAGIGGIVSEGEDGVWLDPSYRWHIGSNTKAMTAALYARMVDRTICRWGATVPNLFPGVAAHPAWADIRIEDLLSHTSGVTDEMVDGSFLDAHRTDDTSPREQRRTLVARLLASPPPERPGIYRYGNLNYVLIGSAIELAADLDWERAMREQLFAPLGIVNVGFGAPPRTGPWGRLAQAAALKLIDPAGVADNPAVLWPSGGVHITAPDYAQFLSVFLRDGPPLLRPATVAQLLNPARPDGRYAGGWSLDGPVGAPAARLTHNGSNSFWFATAILERDREFGYAAMTNCGGQHGARATASILGKMQRPLDRTGGLCFEKQRSVR